MLRQSITPRPPAFAVRTIEQVRSVKRRFLKLEKNGHCQFDDFLLQLATEGGYDAEMISIFSIINQLTNLRPMRGNKHHELGDAYTHLASNGKSYRVRHYEIKTSNLRVYYVHFPPHDEIVVLLGKKNTQGEDLTSFEGLVAQYLEFVSTI